MNKGRKNDCWYFLRILVFIVLCILFGFAAWYFLPLCIPFRVTTTTSIYATLIPILLALLTLAITAFIFLSTALKDRRQPFEQEAIRAMLDKRTSQLLGLTVGGLFCLAACVFLDNTTSAFFQEPLFIASATVLSFVESVLLIWYIWYIIKYESDLRSIAKKARKKLYSEGGGSTNSGDEATVFKLIGDLELLVNQLLHNHKDNFHRADGMDTLNGITTQDFADKYKRLISYRDFLRVEGLDAAGAGEWESVRKDIWALENDLREKYLKGERLKNLSFVAPFLEQGDKPFCLQTTVFTGSAFEKVDLACADLTSADFSQTRLNGIRLLKGATCKETIFSESVWKEVKVDTTCNFEKAVFRDADLGRQAFRAEPGQVFRFQNASFDGANLLDCVFQSADLRFANFQNALLIQAVLNTVCLSYASLRRATLTGMELKFDQTGSYPFPPKEYWQPSQRDQAGNPFPGYEVRWRGHSLGPAFFMNLEHAVLSQAYFSDYNFTGSRFAGANLSDTLFKYCIFDRCFGQYGKRQGLL